MFLMSKMLLMVERVSHQSELSTKAFIWRLDCFLFIIFVFPCLFFHGKKKEFENALSVLISNLFVFCFFVVASIWKFLWVLTVWNDKDRIIGKKNNILILCTNWDKYTQNSRLILMAIMLITQWCLVFFYSTYCVGIEWIDEYFAMSGWFVTLMYHWILSYFSVWVT